MVSRDGLVRLKQVAGRPQDLLDVRRLTGGIRGEDQDDGEDG